MQNTLSFYRANMPRGQAFVITESWATGVTPAITVDPQANEEIFIEEIGIHVSDPLTMPAGKNIVFEGLKEDDGTTDFEVHTLEELKALMDSLVLETGKASGKIRPRPPLKLTDSGAETLVIQHTDGAAGAITAGTITFVIKGWKLAEADD